VLVLREPVACTGVLARTAPEIIDQEEEFEMEAIRKHRFGKWRGSLYKQYLVKWKGYPEWENTWEWECNRAAIRGCAL